MCINVYISRMVRVKLGALVALMNWDARISGMTGSFMFHSISFSAIYFMRCGVKFSMTKVN